MQKIIQFFREAMAELSRVAWPTRQKTTHYTVLVIIISIAVAIFLGVLDYFFGLGIGEFLVRDSGEPITTAPEVIIESEGVEIQADVVGEAAQAADEITILEEEN